MNLLDAIKSKNIMFFDGGMGTQLSEKGLDMGGYNNITHPEEVKEIHREYLNSGSDILITNTLTMNRIYMGKQANKFSIKDINQGGAELAKSVLPDNETKFVVGDISATGRMLKPYGSYTEEQFIENFEEQASFLEEGGVDGFLIETMMDLREALCAVKACKNVSELPILASISFSTAEGGGYTMMGNQANSCARELRSAGADVIGTNCGDIDPFEMAEIVKIYKQNSELPILAQPNAGKPKLEKGKTVFSMEEEEFTKGIKACIDAGASLVGGCCGTSPKFIKALNDKIKK